jgi:glucose-6-phosphate isomerase
VASKTFTTQETMLNAHTARQWLCAAAGEHAARALPLHFVAVTSAVDKAAAFGLPRPTCSGCGIGWAGVIPVVGGGPADCAGDRDEQLRAPAGRRAGDGHAFPRGALRAQPAGADGADRDLEHQFPGAATSAVLPYHEALRFLPSFLQQLEMESNGKTVGRDGKPLACQANPIVWGEIGSNGQHAFFQLLHQGGWLVPCDFIASAQSDYPLPGTRPR